MGNTPCTERTGDVKGDEDSGWLFNALDFCDRGTRSNCIFLSKRHYKILTTDASFRWRLERLHAEHGIYFPSALPKDKTWRSMFLELDKKRHLWEAEDLHDSNSLRIESGETYSISVFARFKPLNIDCDHIQNGRKAVLPLHQRLALIRISNGLDSNRDALCVLKEQGGWFKEKWDGIEDSSRSDDIAQISQDNASDLLTSGIKMIDSKNSRVVVVDPTTGLREFEFDCVIEEHTPQEDVYEESTRGLVCDVINGVSATCLVYGQTGSGKTFTMFGTQESHFFDSNLVGIIPRACSELMSAVKFRRETLNLNIECTVSVSFVEVYGNDILDLLKKGGRCGHSKVSAQRCVLDGNAEVPVHDINDVMKLLNIGEAQRRKAATAMNSRSSRAHSVFIVSLNQKCLDTGKNIQSKLFLADLGGCEQTKKSKLEAGKSKHIEALKECNKSQVSDPESSKDELEYSTGFVKSDRMREAVNINLGVLSLKSCVEALSRGERVPYSNSKLTMLLASGLGGNSRTAVIVCAAQEEEHASETINALKFGQSCRMISNTVRTQSDMLGELMKELDRKIAECEERIRKNEKWVVKEETRSDRLAEKGTLEAEGFGGIEVRKTTLLVGAEVDRQQLNDLLMKKSQLSGSFEGDSNYTDSTFGGNIGFGKAHEYGLGNKYSSDEKENYRFNEANPKFIPDAVKRTKDASSMNEAVTKKAKGGRLAYSGVSA